MEGLGGFLEGTLIKAQGFLIKFLRSPAKRPAAC